ncbi:protein FAM24B [Saccopteryx bilineata]|uniref:protein FAM24B n=1 Tax=Saccopteryx bilineata TaxID=59482 RepID=UPI00338FE391
MFCIGGGILLTMLVLMGVVICLYLKVAKALKASMPPTCLALKYNPLMVTQDKRTAATPINPECCTNHQCCDECSLCANLDSLPPCFCNVNEGL